MQLSNFEKAVELASAAAYIDYRKPLNLGHQNTDAEKHIEFLHSLAEELAGDRVAEIYGNSGGKYYADKTRKSS